MLARRAMQGYMQVYKAVLRDLTTAYKIRCAQLLLPGGTAESK